MISNNDKGQKKKKKMKTGKAILFRKGSFLSFFSLAAVVVSIRLKFLCNKNH